MIKKENYFTAKEVADIVGVSVPTVYRWMQSKLLTATRYGVNRKLVSRIELQKFIEKYNYELDK